MYFGREDRKKILIDSIVSLLFLFATHFVSLFYFLLLLFIPEEVSARIVQVVTAEAVAVLKGEQEKEAQQKDQPAALPLGK